MGDDANSESLCDMCKETLEHSGSKVTSTSQASSLKYTDLTCPPETKEQSPFDSSYNYTDDISHKIGYIDKKLKEIIKVTRVKNKDGSIREEKEVITVTTAKQKPHITKILDSRIQENKTHLDPTISGVSDHLKDTFISSFQKLSSKDTKAKHKIGSQEACESELKTSTSTDLPKKTVIQIKRTNVDGNICITKITKLILSPDCNVLENRTNELKKSLKDLPVDSVTCEPKKTTSFHGSPQSNTGNQKAISVYKQVPKTLSGNKISAKRAINDKENMRFKDKTISVDAVWRDAGTSTANLVVSVPKRASNTKTTIATRKEARVISENSSREREKGYKTEKSNGYCTVKIISKPMKISSLIEREKLDQDLQKVLLSILDVINKASLSSSATVKDSTRSIPAKKNKIKYICKSCISKFDNMSLLKTIGLESVKTHVGKNYACNSQSAPLTHSQKQSPSIHRRNSGFSYSNSSNKMAQTSSKSICCSSKKSSSVSCLGKASTASATSTKDISTCTKRSSRFDVRPIVRRNTSKKINLNDCTCYSDSYLHRNKVKKGLIRKSRSYDCDCFFRW